MNRRDKTDRAATVAHRHAAAGLLATVDPEWRLGELAAIVGVDVKTVSGWQGGLAGIDDPAHVAAVGSIPPRRDALAFLDRVRAGVERHAATVEGISHVMAIRARRRLRRLDRIFERLAFEAATKPKEG